MSRDLTTVAALAGGVIATVAYAQASTTEVTGLMQRTFGDLDAAEATVGAQSTTAFVAVCLPPAVGAFIGYFIASAVQMGWPPAFKKPSFDLGKIFTLSSIKSVLSPAAMGKRALFSTAKIAFVAAAGLLAIHTEYSVIEAAPPLEPAALAPRLGSAVLRLCSYAGMALVALALADYAWNRRTLAGKMRMSKDEVKREHKQQDGDPVIKSARKRRQRELAQRRLQVQVTTADVIVVNPTHYSVALRYRADESDAPRVVAKGRGPMAAKIRELARQHGIPVLSRPPLTRLLYKLVPEGREVPSDVYHAVAEVLAFVYRVTGARTTEVNRG